MASMMCINLMSTEHCYFGDLLWLSPVLSVAH
jgi:hypothetical protein